MTGTSGVKDSSVHAGSLVGEAGAWNVLQPRGKPPAPRYEHAVASLGGSMFVVGGNCSAFPLLSLCLMAGAVPLCLQHAEAKQAGPVPSCSLLGLDEP